MPYTSSQPTSLGLFERLPWEIFYQIFDEVIEDGISELEWWDSKDICNPEFDSVNRLFTGVINFPLNNILEVNWEWHRLFLPIVLGRTRWTFSHDWYFQGFLSSLSGFVDRPGAMITRLRIEWDHLYEGERGDDTVVPILASVGDRTLLPNLVDFGFEFRTYSIKERGIFPGTCIYADNPVNKALPRVVEALMDLEHASIKQVEVFGLESMVLARSIQRHMMGESPATEETDNDWEDDTNV